jgi:hypothetical protein
VTLSLGEGRARHSRTLSFGEGRVRFGEQGGC